MKAKTDLVTMLLFRLKETEDLHFLRMPEVLARVPSNNVRCMTLRKSIGSLKTHSNSGARIVLGELVLL